MNIDSRFAITAAVFLVLFSNSSNIAGRAQDATLSKSADHSELAAALAFEAEPKGNMPGGWGGGPQETIFVDEKVVHGGRRAARIERTPASTNNFTSVTKSIPVDFAGATIELRASCAPKTSAISQDCGCVRTGFLPRSLSTTCRTVT